MMFASPMIGMRPGMRGPMTPPRGHPQTPSSSMPADDELSPEEMAERMAEASKEAAKQMRRLQDETGTPVVGIQRGGRMASMMGGSTETFSLAAYEEGIAVFPSVARAARTVSQLQEWRDRREGLPDIL
jgi:hypothetical protein